MKKAISKLRSLLVESLESRQLMAGDISYSSSTKTLTVQGDQYNDQVVITFDGNNVKADLKAQRSNGSFDHRDRTIRTSDVQRIVIKGLNGDDQVSVYQNGLSGSPLLANVAIEFQGGNGNDTFANFSQVKSTAFGGEGNDSLQGGESADLLYGEGGNDTLNGSLGADTLWGGIGNDTIYGGYGGDVLYGESGNDALYGEAGDDYLFGGDGADSLYGGLDNDSLRGEAGDDKIYGAAGVDLLFGGAGNDWMDAGDGNDIVQGEAGNDVMYGGNGNDLMLGGAGNDTMMGDAGEDSLYGNEGNDYLDGGYDGMLDYLVGGAGSDTFRSKRVHRIALGVEIIREQDSVGDFSTGDSIVKHYVT
jgi:Ca2+-binding RTX toxin-like protein